MDLTGLWPFIIVLSIFCGLFIGSWVKRKSQMIIPLNDPVSLLLILGFFGILVMPDLVPEYAYIDPYDMNQLACVVGFLIAYLYGYWKGELLCVFVSAHDIWKLRQEIRPIAYYYNSRGDLCWQPQRMTYVLKRMVFNVDCPLDYDVGSIARRREVVFQGKYIKMSAHVVDTAKMEIRTEYVRGRLLRHKVLRCHFDPSPLNTYDEYDFYINGSIADEYVRNYQRLKIDNMNAAAGMQAMRQYLKGVEYGQIHTWIASGDSDPEYAKRGAHSLPELLHLEMFTLERIEVDPVLLLEWMREREDTAALLREQPRHEAALAAKDAELEQARAELFALREENTALKAALEQARQQESQGMRWYGLIAVVEQARKAGLTPQETAARLKAAGASYAVIAGLLHPEGDIKDWLQYGKNLLAGMVKEKLPW